MQNYKQFIKDIHLDGTYFQIGGVNTVDHIVKNLKDLDTFLSNNSNKDIYFCANVDKQDPMRSIKTKTKEIKYPTKDRASDIDIIKKKYIYFDFDIRKELKGIGVDITDEQIKEVGLDFGNSLLNVDIFCDWSYIVFSGNGLHIYYIQEDGTIINKDDFGSGYDFLAIKLDKMLGFETDKSCKNPARIARIPGSYNNKNGNHIPCEIIAHRDIKSNIINQIQEIGKHNIEIKKEEERMIKELQEIRIQEGNLNAKEIIEKINTMVPIETEIAIDYPNWTFDGRNFWNPDGSRASSAFMSDNLKNVIIVSDSRWFLEMGDYKGVGPYLYRKCMNNMTTSQCINYFKEKYNLT